jgi:Spy/CpxP family protein refolding chaperone
MPTSFNRRDFIRSSAFTAAALTLNSTIRAAAPAKKDKIRMGIIGAGFRSHEHMGNFLQREDVEIIAIADPQQRSIDDALKVFKEYKRPEPVVYKNGDYDYKNLLKRDDIDAVMICSPWGMAQYTGY